MELLVHINKRIKSRPMVQLPVEALLLQYQDPSASSFVTNFTIIYIKMGYPRLPLAKQAELVPCVLNALEGKPQSHQDSLLLLLMPVLGSVTVPADAQKRAALFGLNERPQVAKQLADFMLDVLLLPYGATAQQQEQQSFPIPLGMCEYSFKRVTGDSPMKPEELEQAKLGIVKFISYGVMMEPDILVHLVVAAADTRFNVANAADMELKKIVGGLDWGNPALTTPLFQLYLGTQVLTTKTRSSSVKPELRRQPAGTRIRLKIMPYLSRARGPALVFPACIQVFFDSLYGTNTNPRLKNMALQFSMLIILGSNLSRLIPVAGVLLSGLLKLISEEDGTLKTLAYSAIGKLGQRVPHLVNKDLALLQTFFEALSQEEQETRMSVREALLSMVEAFHLGLEDSSRQLMMEALLAGQVESEEPMARFVAVRYLATVFPLDHAPSRYLLLLASRDIKDEVSTEAMKALYSPGRDTETSENLVFPSFIDMVNVVTEKAAARAQRYSLPFNPDTFTEVVVFLRMCAGKAAQVSLTREGLLLPQPTKWTPLVGRYFYQLQSDVSGRDATARYLALVEQLVMAQASVLPLSALLEAVGSAPDLLAARFSQKIVWLKSLLLSTKEKVREAAAQLYGTVVAHGLGDKEFDEAVSDLIDCVKGKTLETQHGCVLALAHALERRIILLKKKGDTEKVVGWPAYQDGVNTMVSLLSHQNVLLLGAACISVGELARCFALPLPAGSNDTKTGKLDIVKKLQGIVNNTKLTTKVKERAAMTLGFLCVGEIFPHSREVIQGFLDLAKDTRDVDVHLTVGEALVCCVLSSASPQARDGWSVLEEEFEGPGNTCGDQDLEWLMAELLNKMAPNPHPNIRQASCIWLLALLKHCGHCAPVRQQLNLVQKTFMDMLSDNNDVVQDVASKGLGLVYESSDEEARSRLMGELLDQLTQGRRTVSQVTSNTKLFEEGQLGKAPTGGNLSTYKELCDLASDLNQPELIYKFMHLANHNAIWNSKKGAAFGFSTIAASAGEQLSQYLPKIVPRLYRYQYDPTPRIQMSMTSIWRALVPEPQKTIEQYHSEILSDLLNNLINPQWRVRMSCCLGLSDFLRGGYNKSLHDCLEELPRMWRQLFRVMDDVHEGTRQAATNTTNVLSKLTIRSCEASQGKAGEEIIQTILPVLLENGICNTVAEVRAISLQCVSQLVGSAGALLKPHLSQLIPALLEATSELELRGLSQLSVGLGGDRDRQEIVDSLRASAAKSHYTTETVTKCVQYVDAETLESLVPRIIELMRASVGLGTRVACAHLVVLLAQHLKLELQPYTGKLLATLVNGLLDRNSVIRKNYATTIGHLVSTAKDSSVEKLMEKLRTWYFEKEDESVRSALALTLQAVGRQNQELLKAHSSVVLPLSFLAMHAVKSPELISVEIWEDVWTEATPGTESGIRQNLPEICSVLKDALESPSWTMKAQAARAVATVASKVGTTMNQASRQELVSVLLNGLSGRTWNGKENLLQALASVCTGCKMMMRQEDCQVLVEAVLRECRKDKPSYRQCALQAIGDILLALELDRFSDVYCVVQDIIAKGQLSENGEESENTAEENARLQEQQIRLYETAYETLGKSWPASQETQVMYREKLLEECVSCLPNSTRGVQVAVVAALRSYVDRLLLLEPSLQLDNEELLALNRIVMQLRQALVYALGIAKNTRLKKEALNVLYLLVKKLQEAKQEAVLSSLIEAFQSSLEEASKDNTPEIKSRVVDIKDLIRS
ncbi:proteasome adapter and scaffold protein ECM29 isoform X2 [Anabrus simplex]